MIIICTFTFIFYAIYRIYKCIHRTSRVNPHNKYVLISGCDSGFGRGLAIELDKQGFNVLAGIYIPEHQNDLRNLLSSRATVFHLDITNETNIDNVYDIVNEKTKHLYALVNNAGIAGLGYIDWITMESMYEIMNVNFFGHVMMTKKFLPLLINKKGSRVINVCSISGMISLPGTCSYTASKYALESFSDCLRREMASWDLRVSIIEPGLMLTAMTERLASTLPNLWPTLPIDVQSRWGQQFFNNLIDLMTKSKFATHFDDPSKVVKAMTDAITSTSPQLRYRPGWQASLIFFPMSVMPAWIVDNLMSLGSRSVPAGIQNQLVA